MIVDVEIKGLSPLKRKLLQADLEHTRLSLLDEMQQTAERMKNDRAMKWKIVRLLSKATALSSLTIESFSNGLEALTGAEINLFTYTLEDKKDLTVLEIRTEDTYFQLLDMMSFGGILKKIFNSKKKFAEEVEKTIRDNYTKDYKIEIIEDEKK